MAQFRAPDTPRTAQLPWSVRHPAWRRGGHPAHRPRVAFHGATSEQRQRP